MQKRVQIQEVNPALYQAMRDLNEAVKKENLDKKLVELIKIRASQLNGCAFCIDMHARDARELGESEQRIYALSAWQETPFFSGEERAALALTESITLLPQLRVSDEVYTEVAQFFNEKQIAALIMAIVVINSWNRIAVSTNMSPVAREVLVNAG